MITLREFENVVAKKRPKMMRVFWSWLSSEALEDCYQTACMSCWRYGLGRYDDEWHLECVLEAQMRDRVKDERRRTVGGRSKIGLAEQEAMREGDTVGTDSTHGFSLDTLASGRDVEREAELRMAARAVLEAAADDYYAEAFGFKPNRSGLCANSLNKRQYYFAKKNRALVAGVI